MSTGCVLRLGSRLDEWMEEAPRAVCSRPAGLRASVLKQLLALYSSLSLPRSSIANTALRMCTRWAFANSPKAIKYAPMVTVVLTFLGAKYMCNYSERVY
jgi:hypothetical protein